MGAQMDREDGQLVAYVEEELDQQELSITDEDGYESNIHSTMGIWVMEMPTPIGILRTQDKRMQEKINRDEDAKIVGVEYFLINIFVVHTLRGHLPGTRKVGNTKGEREFMVGS